MTPDRVQTLKAFAADPRFGGAADAGNRLSGVAVQSLAGHRLPYSLPGPAPERRRTPPQPWRTDRACLTPQGPSLRC